MKLKYITAIIFSTLSLTACDAANSKPQAPAVCNSIVDQAIAKYGDIDSAEVKKSVAELKASGKLTEYCVTGINIGKTNNLKKGEAIYTEIRAKMEKAKNLALEAAERGAHAKTAAERKKAQAEILAQIPVVIEQGVVSGVMELALNEGQKQSK